MTWCAVIAAVALIIPSLIRFARSEGEQAGAARAVHHPSKLKLQTCRTKDWNGCQRFVARQLRIHTSVLGDLQLPPGTKIVSIDAGRPRKKSDPEALAVWLRQPGGEQFVLLAYRHPTAVPLPPPCTEPITVPDGASACVARGRLGVTNVHYQSGRLRIIVTNTLVAKNATVERTWIPTLLSGIAALGQLAS